MQIPVFSRHLYQFVLMCAAALLTSGCNNPGDWDKEYACNGQEHSRTNVQGRPSYEKQYSINIDFHIRSDAALVKSYQVRLVGAGDRQMNFKSKSGAYWVSGIFDPKTGVLDLVEGRTVTIDGAPQETRITGNYRCVASGTVTL